MPAVFSASTPSVLILESSTYPLHTILRSSTLLISTHLISYLPCLAPNIRHTSFLSSYYSHVPERSFLIFDTPPILHLDIILPVPSCPTFFGPQNRYIPVHSCVFTGRWPSVNVEGRAPTLLPMSDRSDLSATVITAIYCCGLHQLSNRSVPI